MDPKSGKPLRLFVNPFAIWTGLAAKSAEAMLVSAQAMLARANAPRVAVIPNEDAPPRKAKPAARAKAGRKKTKGKKRRAKRN
jgi:hypothetical protein